MENRKTILIIDDQSALDGYMTFFDNWNYASIGISDPRVIEQIINDIKVDLLLIAIESTDYKNVDGYKDVGKKLKEKGISIPIVYSITKDNMRLYKNEPITIIEEPFFKNIKKFFETIYHSLNPQDDATAAYYKIYKEDVPNLKPQEKTNVIFARKNIELSQAVDEYFSKIYCPIPRERYSCKFFIDIGDACNFLRKNPEPCSIVVFDLGLPDISQHLPLIQMARTNTNIKLIPILNKDAQNSKDLSNENSFYMKNALSTPFQISELIEKISDLARNGPLST